MRRLILAMIAALASVAQAQPESRVVTVDRIRGPHGRQVRVQLARAVERAGLDAVPAEEASGAEPVGHIEGRIRRAGRRWQIRLKVTVRDQPAIELRATARRGAAAIDRLVADLDPPFQEMLDAGRSTRAAQSFENEVPEPPPALDGEAEDEAEPEDDSVASDPDFPRIEALAELSLVSRRLRFGGDIFGELRGHRVAPSPAFGLVLRSFPLARRGGPVGQLGLELRWLRSVEVRSERADGLRFPTRLGGYDLALLAGTRLSERISLRGAIGWSKRFVSVSGARDDSDVMQNAGVPSVGHRSLFLRGEVRIQLPRDFSVHGGLRGGWLLGAGQIASSDWLPMERGYELGGHVEAEMRVGVLRVALRLAHRRYVLNFDPELDASRVAGGAADSQWEMGVRTGAAF